MPEPATTGVTEPACRIIPGSAIRIEALHETYVTPQELKDSIPLDGCIHNYDSAYHIIFTNVKTIQQFSPRTGGSLPPANNVAELGMECAAAHIASRLLRGGSRGRGLLAGN